jgi:hypothetical protein
MSSKAFEALESYGEIVALMSGVRQKFIEAGWSAEYAEKATLTVFSGVFGGNRQEV